MFVKICGITRLEDAQLAVALGATALGFVLWKESPRAIAPEHARRIIDALPPGVLAVGVFVNAELARLQELAGRTGIGAAQLHGDESAEYCGRVGLPVIKAVRLHAQAGAREVEHVAPGCTLLVDSFHPLMRGGTGRRADWASAAALARVRRTVLAGGLHAGNVADAIRSVRPWGIDVSSGVESEPGVKDAARLRAFFDAATPHRPPTTDHLTDHRPPLHSRNQDNDRVL
ncbi:MAG: phosphoribosylanthranilate isomerase [Bacteroidales bacterium]